MAEKKKTPKAVSPVGVFRYPKLNKLDFGTKEYPKPDGEWSVDLILRASDPATRAFITKLQAAHDEAVTDGEAKFAELKPETKRRLKTISINPLYSEVYDKNDKPTGEILFKFRRAGTRTDRDTGEKKPNARPAVFDTVSSKPMANVPEIWGGTEGAVAFSYWPYFVSGTGLVGLKLALDAVQIVELVQGGERDADDYGFSQDGGGFAAATGADSDTSDDSDEDAPAF